MGNVYALSDKPGLKGEIAFAAVNNGGHWIIELKPDGTEKRTRRIPEEGKVAKLI